MWRKGGYVGVTPVTARLITYWTAPDREKKLFFCQNEALETAIYITEVAKKYGDATDGTAALKPILRPYDTLGSTRYVDFDTTRPVFPTCVDKSHISHVVADTGSWEQKMAEALGIDPRSIYRHLAGQTVPRRNHIATYEKLFSERLNRPVTLKQSGKVSKSQRT